MSILKNILAIPELRKRLLFTIICLIIFRLGAQIPAPGINAQALEALLSGQQNQGGILQFLDIFAGGALSKFAILALGIMPYISASIIMQLLQAIVPALERLAKEGDHGRKKIQMYTKYGTILLCVVQSIGLLILLGQTHNDLLSQKGIMLVNNIDSFSFKFTFVLTLSAGTMFLLWLGEQITDRGVGNGVSLLIFAGIAARIPKVIFDLTRWGDEINPIHLLLIAFIFVIIIGLVVTEQQATRKIPVQYAKRVVGNKMYGAKASFIPFKINPSGVIPIIFASSIIIIPTQILAFYGKENSFLQSLANALRPDSPLYIILYLIMVVLFAFFYTQVYFNPVEMADNMKKQGGFIPGIRPGANTSAFLSKVLNRITLPGALYLGFIAIIPQIILAIFNVPTNLAYVMGGTSLLIMVGVALDTIKQIESHLLMRNYPGFLKKGKIKSRRG